LFFNESFTEGRSQLTATTSINLQTVSQTHIHNLAA
jgi:hypothetical protein